jgi:hypothetical protein
MPSHILHTPRQHALQCLPAVRLASLWPPRAVNPPLSINHHSDNKPVVVDYSTFLMSDNADACPWSWSRARSESSSLSMSRGLLWPPSDLSSRLSTEHLLYANNDDATPPNSIHDYTEVQYHLLVLVLVLLMLRGHLWPPGHRVRL